MDPNIEQSDPSTDLAEDVNVDELQRSDRSRWQRAALSVLFIFIYQISIVVFSGVTIFQVGALLVTGHRWGNLVDFSDRLTAYMLRVLHYICLYSETPPWPVGPQESPVDIVGP